MPSHDLNLLTALDVLLAEGSVVGAAKRLRLSPSAMSRTLARLRDAVGDPILVRAGRSLVPTPRAIALRERVRQVIEDADAVFSTDRQLDLGRLEQSFTIRANDGFVEAFGARLIALVTAAAPGVRLRFAPKPDKDISALREARIDLDIGTEGEIGPELLRQTLFRDRFVGVVRVGHPLLKAEITPETYAACNHVAVSRRGLATGPVDHGLAMLGLTRRVVAIVGNFPSALSIVRDSDLVGAVSAHATLSRLDGLERFELPVPTPPLVITQMWHPRSDADPAHRWLRGCFRQVCA
jgi:DNA-binding transcriptional LysR family regulator